QTPPRGCISLLRYITVRFPTERRNEDGCHRRGPRRSVRGARGSDAQGDPQAAGEWRSHGDRAREAVPGKPARDHEAPEGPGAGRIDLPEPGSSAAALPA